MLLGASLPLPPRALAFREKTRVTESGKPGKTGETTFGIIKLLRDRHSDRMLLLGLGRRSGLASAGASIQRRATSGPRGCPLTTVFRPVTRSSRRLHITTCAAARVSKTHHASVQCGKVPQPFKVCRNDPTVEGGGLTL